MATVRLSKLLGKLELEDRDLILEREGIASLPMWSILVVQYEQYVIYRLMMAGGENKSGLIWIQTV